MITIYNESNNPYEFSHVKTSKKVFINKSSKDSTLSIKISKLNDIFHDEEIDHVNTLLSESTNMKHLNVLSEDKYSVIFSRTDFSPYLISYQNSNKEILLVTLNMKDRVLINIDSFNSFIADHYITDEELSMFMCITDKERFFTIDLYDTVNNDVITYSFLNDYGKLSLHTTTIVNHIMDKEEIESFKHGENKVIINNFKPRKATYRIITKTNTVPLINREHHKLSVIKNVDESLDTTLKFLQSNMVKALTINAKGFTGYELQVLLRKCKECMEIVYLIDYKEKLHKVKL